MAGCALRKDTWQDDKCKRLCLLAIQKRRHVGSACLRCTQLLQGELVLHAVALELHVLHVGHRQARLEHLDSVRELLTLHFGLLHALVDLLHSHDRLLAGLLLLQWAVV